jgi:hypothetical protein
VVLGSEVQSQVVLRVILHPKHLLEDPSLIVLAPGGPRFSSMVGLIYVVLEFELRASSI